MRLTCSSLLRTLTKHHKNTYIYIVDYLHTFYFQVATISLWSYVCLLCTLHSSLFFIVVSYSSAKQAYCQPFLRYTINCVVCLFSTDSVLCSEHSKPHKVYTHIMPHFKAIWNLVTLKVLFGISGTLLCLYFCGACTKNAALFFMATLKWLFHCTIWEHNGFLMTVQYVTTSIFTCTQNSCSLLFSTHFINEDLQVIGFSEKQTFLYLQYNVSHFLRNEFKVIFSGRCMGRW